MEKLVRKGYLIERPEESREYINAFYITGKYLQNFFNKYNQIENVQKDGFNWLRTQIISPTFDSMNFRYKNKVFSVFVDLVDIIDGEVVSYFSQKAKDLQIKICKENNLIPCTFKVKIKNLQPATVGWNLFSTVDNKKINPLDSVSNDLVPISNWELLNFGITIVMDDLEKKGEKILSFTDAPDISPNIWFEDEYENKNWVHVSVNGKNKKPNYLKNNIPSEYKGYVANVSILPIIDKNVLYRAQPANIFYDGLEKF